MNFVLLVSAFFFLEFVAWSNHKYIMHGFLWKWHKDHHRKDAGKSLPEKTEDKKFEKNDLFFVVYALPAIILMIVGFATSYFPIVYIAIGITLYGFTYFLIHDIIIHKRLNIPFLFRKPKFFMQAIIRAHTAHHWPKNKKDFHTYGLLIFPFRYFKKYAMSLYFNLLLLSLLVPLALSFDKKLSFYRQWKFVLPSIALFAFFFIVYDIYMTKQGVWGFNSRYISGQHIWGLPAEEWLFFIVIPYASIFLHEAFILYYPKLKLPGKASNIISIMLIIASTIIILMYPGKIYTVYACGLLILSLLISLFCKNLIINNFYLSFILILVPFLIVNGILTGTFIEEEVVWYNNHENMGIRILTIPVEDFAYGFSMILFNLLLIGKLKIYFTNQKLMQE